MKTIDYDKVKELYEQKYTDPQIAKTLEINKCTVWEWRKANGLKANGHKIIESNEKERIVQLYQNGYSDNAIAKTLNRPTCTISLWLRRNGYPPQYVCSLHQPPIEVAEEDKPWYDPESLYCDTPFLDEIMRKPVRRVKTDAIQ